MACWTLYSILMSDKTSIKHFLFFLKKLFISFTLTFHGKMTPPGRDLSPDTPTETFHGTLLK
jgi:hypothetical protein